MRTMERTFAIDRNLARRAEAKFRRYGTSIEGVLTVLVSCHGLPKELRPTPRVPSVIEFETQGEHFVADVKPDDDSYFAQVRGLPDCFTCGDNEAELRKNLVEVTNLMHFDIGEVVHNPDGSMYS